MPGVVPQGKVKYVTALGMTWKYFAAQRSGAVPDHNDVSWRSAPSHVNDPVPGGWYDAGDYLKLNFPLAPTVGMLAWGMVDFRDGYSNAQMLGKARNTLRIAAEYLYGSYNAVEQTYIGQIGDPDEDHAFWGRAEDEAGKRPAYKYKPDMGAADLYGAVSGALAATSVVFTGPDTFWAQTILPAAVDLYRWGKEKGGKYSAYYKKQTASIYPSSDYLDSLAWAAGWLYRATGDATYLAEAATHWSQGNPDVFPGWDSLWAAHAVHMVGLADQGTVVPGIESYRDFVVNKFLKAWINANGE